jgi:hypothetical protein
VTRIPQLEQELVAAAGRLRSPRRLLRPAMRAALAAAAVAVVVVLAVVVVAEKNTEDRRGDRTGTPTLQPGARLATDGEAGVSFTLHGRVLTVQVLPSAPSKTRNRVNGARIRATCGKGFAQGPGPGAGPDPLQARTRFWPAGRTSMRYQFPEDISQIASWCRLEDPVVGHVAFVKFGDVTPADLAAAKEIEETGNKWARLFAASDPAACEGYMTQPACERESCVRVGPKPVPNCRLPSAALRLSFRRARVEDVVVDGKFAGARFSNGRTVLFIHVEGTKPNGAWWIDKFRGNAGRAFFEK